MKIVNTKKPINIFIVEDNEIFNLTLKADIENTFNDVPLKIHSFETGEDCMKKFKEEKPQMVILDYNLNSKVPNAANGITVLDWIKSESNDTSVIMLTGDDNLDIAVKSFKHGASDYIVKTETKFKKINYSLLNQFKIMEAKQDAKKYKLIVAGLFVCLSLFVGGIVTFHMIDISV